MKKLAILIMTSAILLSLASAGYAAEFLGYSTVPKQLKFYTIILSVIGVSVAMVSAVYISLWVVDLKKKRLNAAKAALHEGKEAFGRQLAAQPAK